MKLEGELLHLNAVKKDSQLLIMIKTIHLCQLNLEPSTTTCQILVIISKSSLLGPLQQI